MDQSVENSLSLSEDTVAACKMWCRLRMRMTRYRSVGEIYFNSYTCTMEEIERLSQQIEAPPQVEWMLMISSSAVKFSDKSSSSKKMKGNEVGISSLKIKNKKVKKYHILSPSASKKQTSDEKQRENRVGAAALEVRNSNKDKAFQSKNQKQKQDRNPPVIIRMNNGSPSKAKNSDQIQRNQAMLDELVLWIENGNVNVKEKKAGRMEVGAEPLKISDCDGQSRRVKGKEKLRSPTMEVVYKTVKNTISRKDFTKAGVNIKSVASLTDAPLEIGKMTNNPSPFRSRSQTPSADMTEAFPWTTSLTAGQMSRLSSEQQLVCDGIVSDSPISGSIAKKPYSTAVYKKKIERVSIQAKCHAMESTGAPSTRVRKLKRRGVRMDSDADTKTSKAVAETFHFASTNTENGLYKIQNDSTQESSISLPHGINGSRPNDSVMSVYNNPHMTYNSPLLPAPWGINFVNSNGPNNMMLLDSFLMQMAYNNPYGASSYNLRPPPVVVPAPNMISITSNGPYFAALPAAPSNYLSTFPNNPNASFTVSLPSSSADHNPTPIIRPIARKPGQLTSFRAWTRTILDQSSETDVEVPMLD